MLTGEARRRLTTGRSRWWVLAVASLAVIAVVAGLVLIPDGTSGDTVSGETASTTVGADGFVLEVAGVRISAPAGVAPVGTPVTARLLSEGPDDAPLPRAAGSPVQGVDVSLDGRQPDRPITIVFPTRHRYADPESGTPGPDDLLPLVLTRPGADDGALRVEAGTADAQAGTLTVTVDHLTPFWEWPAKARDFADRTLRALLLGETEMPACAAQNPVEEPSGREIHLIGPPRFAWHCVRIDDQDVVVTLRNTVPAPLRVDTSAGVRPDQPGTLSPVEAMTIAVLERLPAYGGRSALLPQGGERTFRVPIGSLPATVTMTAEPGAYLLGALLTLGQEVADLFGVKLLDGLRSTVGAGECFAGAWPAATAEFGPGTVADVITAFVACSKPAVEQLGLGPADAFALLAIVGAGVPLVVTGIGGAVVSALGSSEVRVERGPPVSDPCSSSAALREAVEHADPRLIDPQWVARVELLGCAEGHAVGQVYPHADADIDYVVLAPDGDTWQATSLSVGYDCGSTGFPAGVEELIECIELPTLSGDYWALNDVCRGTSGPQSDAACAARNELTRQSAEESMAAFLAAWRNRDRAGLTAHIAPGAEDALLRTVLGSTLRDIPPDCDYSFTNGTYQCAVEVSEGDWGMAVRFEQMDDLLWQATFIGPIDVG